MRSGVNMAKAPGSQLLAWGVATRSRVGETSTGDSAVVTPVPGGTLVAAVDGCGHGVEAARAARIACDLVRRAASSDLVSLASQCHDLLKRTRGAAMSLAFLSAVAATITWLGIGSVQGRLLSGGRRSTSRATRSLRLVSGVVGHNVPSLTTATLTLEHGDVVVFATDGIAATFADALELLGHPQEIADRIVADHWKGTDDALVVVARYLAARP